MVSDGRRWKSVRPPGESAGRPGALPAAARSGGRGAGLLGSWIKPTLSPTRGAAGAGGGGGGAAGGGGTGGASATGTFASTTGSSIVVVGAGGSISGGAGSMITGARTSMGAGGSWTGSGAGGGGGGSIIWMTGCTGSGAAGGGAGAGLAGAKCPSRNSAVILSSELEGTRAVAMPSSLALARTSLLSIPSFFAMS